MTMPVSLNHPLSQLQQLASKFGNKHLLDQARMSSLPVQRLAYVVAFELAGVSLSANKQRKAFNPLLF